MSSINPCLGCMDPVCLDPGVCLSCTDGDCPGCAAVCAGAGPGNTAR